jgi:hypothetical protein
MFWKDCVRCEKKGCFPRRILEEATLRGLNSLFESIATRNGVEAAAFYGEDFPWRLREFKEFALLQAGESLRRRAVAAGASAQNQRAGLHKLPESQMPLPQSTHKST